MSECVQIGKWIAGSVTFPVILDGDTGHGGIMAVRRLVRECIEAGLAGVRIDDQPVEGKRRTQAAGGAVVAHQGPAHPYPCAGGIGTGGETSLVVLDAGYAPPAVI